MKIQQSSSILRWKGMVEKTQLGFVISELLTNVAVGLVVLVALATLVMMATASVVKRATAALFGVLRMVFAPLVELWTGFSFTTMVRELRVVLALAGLFALALGLGFGFVPDFTPLALLKLVPGLGEFVQSLPAEQQTLHVLKASWAAALLTTFGVVSLFLGLLGFGQKKST